MGGRKKHSIFLHGSAIHLPPKEFRLLHFFDNPKFLFKMNILSRNGRFLKVGYQIVNLSCLVAVGGEDVGGP